jgi:hypothetical protein
MKRNALALVLGGLMTVLGGVAVLGTVTTRNAGKCCTLTGKTVDACCCVPQKDGKLYCTLAKKTVDSCCCKAAGDK